MTRKCALRRMKIKAAFAAAWEFVKGYLSFSKLLCYGVLLIDYKTTSTTLDLCYIAVANNYTGKWCPRPWMGDDTNTYYGTSGNEQWKKFKERLSGEELDMNIEEARKQLTSCADTGDTPSAWARDAAEFCKRKGIFNGDGAGNYGWQQPITREAVAQILYNAFESAGMLDAIPDKK